MFRWLNLYVSQRTLLFLVWFIGAVFATSVSAAQARTVVVIGDSLSAAYGIPERAGWVALLQERLDKNDYNFNIINASITGETSSGGATRIQSILAEHAPEFVIVELGGNDGLRGLSLKSMRDQLSHIVQSSQASGAKVLLLGMKIPPNYGAQYTRKFEDSFVQIATEHSVSLVPFFLEDVATDLSLMQDDGIHPNAKAQPLMLNRIWPAFEALLQ
ncbi:MAG: arylesterase [Pseudomonadota bacterium]